MCRGSFLITAQPEKATWQNLFRAFSYQNFGTRYHVKGFQRFFGLQRCGDIFSQLIQVFFFIEPPKLEC